MEIDWDLKDNVISIISVGFLFGLGFEIASQLISWLADYYCIWGGATCG